MPARYERHYLRGMSESISTSSAPKPVGSYSHAKRVGNLLFLSEVGPRKACSGNGDSVVPGLEINESGEVVKFDFEAQVHSVFANVKAVLDARAVAGTNW